MLNINGIELTPPWCEQAPRLPIDEDPQPSLHPENSVPRYTNTASTISEITNLNIVFLIKLHHQFTQSTTVSSSLSAGLCNVKRDRLVKLPATTRSNLHFGIYETLPLCDFEPFFNDCNLHDQNNSFFYSHLQSTSFFIDVDWKLIHNI